MLLFVFAGKNKFLAIPITIYPERLFAMSLLVVPVSSCVLSFDHSALAVS